jgi:hypothetical protein
MNEQVTKTKTDYFGVVVLVIGSICSIGLLLWMIYEWITLQKNIALLQRILVTIISALVTPLLWAIELPKLKSVTIDNERITFKSLLTGATKEILLADFDGFKTMGQWTRSGPVYEIILFVNGKRFHDISSNYIKNYEEIKIELGKRLNNLGAEKFEYFRYLKERLTS